MQCVKEGCRANALKNDEYCFWHSPKTAEKRKQAGRRGGSRGKLNRDDNIESIADIQRILAETIAELRTDSSHVVSRGRAVGYLCSIMLTALEKGDLEERISALEAKIGENTTA
jgi:hypothetical protein